MSEPTPPKPQPHHGGQSYTSYYWIGPGKPKCKRFGRVGKVSRSEAMARFRHWLQNDYPRLRRQQEAAYSVQTLCDEYFALIQKRYVVEGEHTASVNRHKTALESFATLYGDSEAADVTSSMVAAWVAKFIGEKRPRGGKGPKTKGTVNVALSYVKAMFRWAAEMGKLPDATAGAVNLVRGIRGDNPDVRHKDPITPVAWADVEATLKELKEPFQSLVMLEWHTGMRPGEAVRMRGVDLVTKGDVMVYTPVRHKNKWRGKSRVIVLGPRAVAVVKPFLTTGAEMFRWNARPVTVWKFRDAVKRAAGRAGVAAWHPNQLRHSYATRVAEQFGELAVQDLLGHASLNQQKVYVEQSIKRATTVAREVG